MISQLKSYDVLAWNLPIINHTNEEIVETFIDGIHQFSLPNNCKLDLCVQGVDHLKRDDSPITVLVGLSGAVSSRNGKKAPFFSGLNIAKSLNLPIIAVSDPTLSLDADIPISWYAGNYLVPDLPIHIAKILDVIAVKLNAKLIIFGGSGGGFASLLLATFLKTPTSVLVWNPQTAIEDYVPSFVAQYLSIAFPEYAGTIKNDSSEIALKKVLDSVNIFHNIRVRPIQSNVKILYLQNQNDWHTIRHAYPYFLEQKLIRIGKGSFTNQQTCTIFFGDWGEGHCAPPKELLEHIIDRIANDTSTKAIVEELEQRVNTPYFHWFDTQPKLQIQLSAVVKEKQIEVKCILLDYNISAEKIKFAFYLLTNGLRTDVQWYSNTSGAIFPISDSSLSYEVVAFVQDSFGCKIIERKKI